VPRDRVKVWLLSAYAATLVLGAWPPELRRGPLQILEAPADLAAAALAKLGIKGGVAVFGPPPARITRVLLQDCIHVRGRVAGRPPEALHPPGGECQTQGLRLTLPRREVVWRSLLIRAATPLNQAVIGDFHCHAGGRGPAVYEAVEVLWSQPWRALYGPERGVAHVIWFRWQCEPPGIQDEMRNPDDAWVHAHWGAP
jgi:hypothetical protein